MDSTKRGIAITLAVIAVIIVSVVSLFVYQMLSPRIMSTKELVNNGAITFEEPRQINDFELIRHNGEPFTKADLQDQWTLLFFGFTNCGGFCPATLALLNSVNQQLESDIRDKTQIVMVSVDPVRDTPEVLAEYMGRFNPGFVGVTGEFLQIKLLSNQFHIGFSKSTQGGENYDMTHGEQIVLINPAGEYFGFFKPPFTLARLKTTYQSIVLSNSD